MIRRCYQPSYHHYHRYGARGIEVCARWRSGEAGLTGFQCFLEDMGPRPAGMTLDRRDNDGSYEPSNCRWATRTAQNRNMSTTRLIEVGGAVAPIGDVADEAGIRRGTLAKRQRLGWTEAQLLSGKNHSSHRALTDEQVAEIRRIHVRGSSEFGARPLARRYGVHLATIQRALTGYKGEAQLSPRRLT